ncbi:hypothetical protein ACEPPN_015129 [Leptodophora sp. 'Broadleaf-Isolate-01']
MRQIQLKPWTWILGDALLEKEEPDGLIHFPRVPTGSEDCQICTRGQTLHGYGMNMLAKSAKSGCSTCSIRYLAVLKTYQWSDTEAQNTPCVLHFRDAIVRYTPLYESHRVRGQFSAHGGSDSIWVYTECGQPESSWPGVGVGRELGRRRETYAGIISRWLDTCNHSHVECPKGSQPLPSRVLEVGKEGSHTLRLRVTRGNDGRYAALSHCWGGMVSIRTLRENYRLHQTSIEFSELPATFRDAVIVTRALGIPYLWIDSLCIIQNDTHDWEAESSNMGAVYQNAYLVIGADMSPNSRQGFLDPERDENYGRGKSLGRVIDEGATIRVRTHKIHFNICAPIPAYAIKRFHGDSRQPLALRAWALQEQLLASKMVHFTTKEIIWRCRECLGCECLELDHKYSTDAEHDDVHFQRILSDPGVDRYVIWYRIVDKLMERSITNKLDIFPALSGLAKKMGEHYVGTYLAGLWSNDILRGLLWTIEGKIPSRITPYRAPSWSWASVDMNFQPYISTWNIPVTKVAVEKSIAKLLDWNCKPIGQDPRGKLSEGSNSYIKISGPMMEVHWVVTDGGGSWVTKTERSVDKFDHELDFETSLLDLNENLYFLLLLTMHRLDSGVRQCGLVLKRRAHGRDAEFERVGVFDFRKTLDMWQTELEESEDSVATIF